MPRSFDECFQVFPEITPPSDLEDFWEKAHTSLKHVPVDSQLQIQIKKSFGRGSLYEVSFASVGQERISGTLILPKMKSKLPVIIEFHDYLEAPFPLTEKPANYAYLQIRLREHTESLYQKLEEEAKPANLPVTRHRFDRLEYSYACQSYLDALRTLDFLRLQKSIQTSRVGVMGHGLGAAMATFLAARAPESVQALALLNPGFVWHDSWLEDSHGPMAQEIYKLLRPKKNVNRKLKESLRYLDPLNWSEELRMPVLCSIGLENEVNPPKPAFGFFNHLQTEKDMQIYPEGEAEATLPDQRKAALEFLREALQIQLGQK